MTDNAAAFNNVMARIKAERQRALERWIDRRIVYGYDGAHPDDGWVNREKNIVAFVYPQFLLHHEAGSLIALGNPEKWRPVRLVQKLPDSVIDLGKTERWQFETFPPCSRYRHWWQRILWPGVEYQHEWQRVPRANLNLYCRKCRAESVDVDY